MNKQSRRTTLIITVLISAIAIGAYVKNWQRAQAFKPNQLTATYLTEARTVSPFALTDMNGQPFTNASLKDHWTVLFFGFTQCSYICPTTMSLLSQTYEMMKQAHLKWIPQIIFVSVDPERDTQAQIKRYVESFHKEFTGVTGDSAAVEKLAKEMAVVYMKVAKTPTDENYDINHSGALLLVNPQGQLQAIFTPPHHPETLAKEFALISKHVSR